ncbi:MAG: AAA family ATPase [Candidatus Obscuribacterales bacterium]|nr:AAA family ATPase [Candidatus Obscuribacterales bacterium]
MISELELINFTVFSKLKVQFSPKLNVIIGENGTGKTHLLKAAYACCASVNENKQADVVLTQKLIRMFLPLEHEIFRLRKDGTIEDTRIAGKFFDDSEIMFSFQQSSKHVSLRDRKSSNVSAAVLIPTKEILSLVEGMTNRSSDEETLKVLFDDTYLDLAKHALKKEDSDSELRLNTDPRYGSVFPALAKAIGGRYRLKDGQFRFQPGFYEEIVVEKQHELGDKKETVFKLAKGSELSNNMTAEGFRKLGLLQQLLANKTINPGVSGPLLWDEPESNMNPKLMRTIVEVLIELSRNGQQIILATHDYVLMKWFELLMDKKGKADHILFHTLYRNSKTNSIEIETKSEYQDIDQNSIAETFSDLTDHELTKSMGTIGK